MTRRRADERSGAASRTTDRFTSVRYDVSRCMTEYDDAAVRDRVGGLDGWSYDGDRLRKTYDFDDYMDGIAFVTDVAELAEDANHHPDLHVGYKEVEVTLKSHDVDGITDRDWDLIDAVEGLD